MPISKRTAPQYLRDAVLEHLREHPEIRIADLRPKARGSSLSTQRSMACTCLRLMLEEGVLEVARTEPSGRRQTPIYRLAKSAQDDQRGEP